MFLVQIRFSHCDGDSSQRESLKHAAESYLSALCWNGQVCGEWLLAWSNAQLIGYTRVPRPDSVARRHHSQWGVSELKKLIEAFGRDPEWKIIDDDAPRRFPSWRRSSSFYLCTHAFDDASPVCCGDSGEPIPVYLLPLSDQDRRDLYSWAGAYKHLDNVWLDSGALEIPAYKQLADPTSDLSVTGRELCARIEKATQKPTFYYLMRYWGRNDGEATRSCPLCGGEWRLPDQNVNIAPFHKFQFKCDNCRLVSKIAVSYEDERHARIGEYKQAGHFLSRCKALK